MKDNPKEFRKVMLWEGKVCLKKYLAFSKLWQVIKKIATLIFILVFTVFFIFYILLIVGAINSEEILESNIIINRIALYAIFLSTPGILLQWVEIFRPQKNKLKGTMKCMSCGQISDVELEES